MKITVPIKIQRIAAQFEPTALAAGSDVAVFFGEALDASAQRSSVPTKPHSHRGRARRGAVYVAVLGVSLLVSLIAALALHLTRLEHRSARQRRDFQEARSLAFSAVEFAMGRVEFDSNWRSVYQSGQSNEIPVSSFSEGRLYFRFLDPDGNLADDSSDPIEVQGRGRVGSTVWVYSAIILRESGEDKLVPGSWKRVGEWP